MSAHIIREGQENRMRKSLRLLLLLALLLPAVAMRSTPAQAAMKVQPLLLQWAAARPTAQVSVVVQKLVKDSSVEKLVTLLGGVVTKDLSIINAFAVTLPAGAIPALAQAPGVRWVSLDAPVNQSGVSTQFTTWATDTAPPAAEVLSQTNSFNATTIPAGRTIWFSAVVGATGLGSAPATITFDQSDITFAANGASYHVPGPDGVIIVDPTAVVATTMFSTTANLWTTRVRPGLTGNVFLVSVAYQVPQDLPGGITPVAWTGRFTTDTPGVTINWKWAASVYTTFSSDYSALGVKPVDDAIASVYLNTDKAGAPENYKPSVITGATRSSGYVGTYSAVRTVTPAAGFVGADAIVDSAPGPDSTFGYANNRIQTFTGFSSEKTPDNAITRVEAVLQVYVPAHLSSAAVLQVRATVDGVPGATITVDPTAFDPYVGLLNVGTIYVDLTYSRPWQWGDFDEALVLTLDQSRFGANNTIYYDAVGFRVTSDVGSDSSGGSDDSVSDPGAPTDTSALVNVYDQVVRATNVWNQGPAYLQGNRIGVAVVDSGVMKSRDLEKRITANANFNSGAHRAPDAYGHGTLVAGIIAGDGAESHGAYMGIAPKSRVINVRVTNDQGSGSESDVVKGLQWVLQNKDRFHIRVVNLSLNSTNAQSYQTSPLDAAVEVLWFNNIVVVVSAGNNGTSTLYPPANDPFVITVGATDDHTTVSLSDDNVASFSAYGTDERGQAKPDLVAPGKNLIAPLPSNNLLTMANQHPQNRVNSNYFRMSGTSMAAPVVAGAVALLLQHEPNLNADQVKYRLKATAVHASSLWPGYDPVRAGAGLLDAYAAINTPTTAAANTGLAASALLFTGVQHLAWNSVDWASVDWASVDWASVDWASVDWASVDWASDYWGP